MKKDLIKLSLAGILALSSSNLSALEVNEKGFQTPDKTNFVLVDEGPTRAFDSNKDIVNGSSKTYASFDTGGVYAFEYSYNGKVESYYLDYGDSTKNYMIQDTNCDGVFETKYSGKDLYKLTQVAPVPACYFKKVIINGDVNEKRIK